MLLVVDLNALILNMWMKVSHKMGVFSFSPSYFAMMDMDFIVY